MNKICTKCGSEKPATTENFYANKKGVEGFNAWCKSCHAQYRKENAAKLKDSAHLCKTKKPEKYKELKKAWNSKNKDKKRMYALNYLARKKLRQPVWFGELDDFVMQEAHNLANARAKAFGFGWAVDHVIPMCGKKVSGLHVYNNVQVIPSSVNYQKHNSFEVK